MKSSLSALLFMGSAALSPAEAQSSSGAGGGPASFTSASADILSGAPALAGFTDSVIGDLWKRTDLSPRDRSIVTVTALIAAGHMSLLPEYLDRALDSGVKPSEINEIIGHLAFYTGWPSAFSVPAVVKGVFTRRGIGAEQVSAGPQEKLTLDPASETLRIASVEQALGSVSPALRDYTNDVLFGDVWRRPGLAPRDRSLVTVSALIAGNKTAQLVGHLNRALDNGLTKQEASAVITHMAFYAGWPNAMSAAAVAKTVFEKRPG